MSEKIILLTPPGYTQDYQDPRVDEVRTSNEVSAPKIMREKLEELPGQFVTPENIGDNIPADSVRRNKISEGTRTTVSDAFTKYQNAVDEYSNASSESDRIAALQKQTEALEVIVAHMWDSVSSDDLGSASTQ